jgi:hypothetical protein
MNRANKEQVMGNTEREREREGEREQKNTIIS